MSGELIEDWRARSEALQEGWPKRLEERLAVWEVQEKPGSGYRYSVDTVEPGAEPLIETTSPLLAAVGAAVATAWCAPAPPLEWGPEGEEGDMKGAGPGGQFVKLLHGAATLERYRALHRLAYSPAGLSYLLEIGGPGLFVEALEHLEKRLPRQARAKTERAPATGTVEYLSIQSLPGEVQEFWRALGARPPHSWTLEWLRSTLQRLEKDRAHSEGEETLVTVHCSGCRKPVAIPYEQWLTVRDAGYLCDECDESFTQPPDAA